MSLEIKRFVYSFIDLIFSPGFFATKNIDELASELSAAITTTCAYLSELGFKIEQLFNATPLDRLSFIQEAINAVLDEFLAFIKKGL